MQREEGDQPWELTLVLPRPCLFDAEGHWCISFEWEWDMPLFVLLQDRESNSMHPCLWEKNELQEGRWIVVYVWMNFHWQHRDVDCNLFQPVSTWSSPRTMCIAFDSKHPATSHQIITWNRRNKVPSSMFYLRIKLITHRVTPCRIFKSLCMRSQFNIIFVRSNDIVRVPRIRFSNLIFGSCNHRISICRSRGCKRTYMSTIHRTKQEKSYLLLVLFQQQVEKQNMWRALCQA